MRTYADIFRDTKSACDRDDERQAQQDAAAEASRQRLLKFAERIRSATHPIPPEGPAEATAHRLNAWMAEVLNEEQSRD